MPERVREDGDADPLAGTRWASAAAVVSDSKAPPPRSRLASVRWSLIQPAEKTSSSPARAQIASSRPIEALRRDRRRAEAEQPGSGHAREPSRKAHGPAIGARRSIFSPRALAPAGEPTKGGWRMIGLARRIVHNGVFQTLIMAVIARERGPRGPRDVAGAGRPPTAPTFDLVNRVIIVIFVVELTLRLVSRSPATTPVLRGRLERLRSRDRLRSRCCQPRGSFARPPGSRGCCASSGSCRSSRSCG